MSNGYRTKLSLKKVRKAYLCTEARRRPGIGDDVNITVTHGNKVKCEMRLLNYRSQVRNWRK
jgi:hypothetical protein